MKKLSNILFALLTLFFTLSSVNGYIIQINGNSMHISNSSGYVDNTDSNIIAYKVNDTLNFEAVAMDNVSNDIINSGYMKWDFGDGSETTYQQNGALKNTTHKYTFPFPYPVSWCGYKENIGYPKSITYNWLVVGDVKNTEYSFTIDTSHDKTTYDVSTGYDNNTNKSLVNITYYSDITTGNYSFSGLSVDTTHVNVNISRDEISEGKSVKFNFSVSRSIIFCMWSFGDGSYSFERAPTHTYSNEGFYYPQVMVVDDYGRVMVGYGVIHVKKARGGYIYWVMGPNHYNGQAYTYVYNSSGDDNDNDGNSYADPYKITYKVDDTTRFHMRYAWGKYWKWDFGDGSETSYHVGRFDGYHDYEFPFMWPFSWVSYGIGSWWKSDTFNFIVVGDVENTRYNFIPSTSHDKTTYDYSYDTENDIVNISYYSDIINTPKLNLKIKDGYYTDIPAMVDKTQISTGQTVNFDFNYAGNPIFVMWCFGDGEHSYEKNPSHKYTSKGLFYPHVFIVDENGNIALGITPPIGVGGYWSYPQIYVSPTIVNTNQLVNITIVEPAYYTTKNHTIRFGDGTYTYIIPGYSPYTFNHSYSSEGIYEINMQVEGCENGKNVYVIDNHAPNAVLYVYPNPASYVQDVVFNPVNSYDPDKGRSIPRYNKYGHHIDNYIIPSTSPIAQIYGYNLTVYNSTGDIVLNVSFNELKEYSHNFPIGNYTANLTVWDGGGKASSTIVSFSVINKKPVADFTYSPNNPKIDQTIYFDASHSYDLEGEITRYHWDFGDGSTGAGKLISHKYNDFGIYPVTLTVWDEKNASSSITKNIIISGVRADFTYKPNYILVNSSVNFIDNSTSAPENLTEWYWDFGDGTTSTEQNPTHTYTKEGIYFVTLRVKNEFGDSDKVVKIIPVQVKGKIPPVAKFTFTVDGTSVFFDASESYDKDGNITQYIWDFGDGTTGTGKLISHNYSESKTYKVTLTVVDDENLTGDTFRFVDISDKYKSIPLPLYVNILLVITTLMSITYIMRGFK